MIIATKELVKMGLFVALALALGFALAHIPNVELITLTIFISGCLLGRGKGVVVGGVAMALFAIFNPLGPTVAPVALAQVVGMGFVGFSGGIIGSRMKAFKSSWVRGTFLAVGGFSLTLFYDILTNLAVALAFGLWERWYAVVIGGITFSLIHIVSNTLIFALVGGTLFRRLS